MNRRRVAVHALTGAYVLDAVTHRERARFERHLASCDLCRTEARGLRETAARLAVVAAIPPHAGLREQTLAAARRVPQATAPDRP